jgi:hypothetical protein
LIWSLTIYHIILGIVLVFIVPGANRAEAAFVIFSYLMLPVLAYAWIYSWAYVLYKGPAPLTNKEVVVPSIPVSFVSLEKENTDNFIQGRDRVTSFKEHSNEANTNGVEMQLRENSYTDYITLKWKTISYNAIRSLLIELLIWIMSLFGSFVYNINNSTINTLLQLNYPISSITSYHTSDIRNNSNIQLANNLGYYQLLNIGVKFSLFRNSNNKYAFRDIRKINRSIISMVLFIVISYGYYYCIILFEDIFFDSCWKKNIDVNVQLCRFYDVYYVFTFCGVITTLSCYLMVTGIFVFIIGATFASIIAWEQSYSWIGRYSSLRRLVVSSGDDDKNAITSWSTINDGNETNSSSENDATTMNILHKDRSNVNEQLNIPLKASLYEIDESKFASLITRDSIEAYMFQNEYMNHVGHQLNTFLTFVVIFCILMVASCVYSFSALDSSNSNLAWVSTGTQMLLYLCGYFFPIVAMAESNIAILKIMHAISCSGFDDYQAIGGKEMWLQLIEQNPCTWKIGGVAITYNVIAGTIVSGLISVAILFQEIIFNYLNDALSRKGFA